MSEENEDGKRKWIHAPWALLVLWGVWGWAVYKQGFVELNLMFGGLIALWSAYRLFTFFRR